MSDYVWDIFISYPHQDHHRVWVLDIFLEDFKLYLRNELGRQVEVYVDKDGIKAGDSWPIVIKNALATSKILVPIWSVDYFLSEWCRRECAAIFHRERALGFRTGENEKGLILPISLFDGKKFPPFTKEIEWLDCTPFNRITPSYKTTPMYDALIDRLKEWVPQVAAAVGEAASKMVV